MLRKLARVAVAIVGGGLAVMLYIGGAVGQFYSSFIYGGPERADYGALAAAVTLIPTGLFVWLLRPRHRTPGWT